jgi:hypothetical protein
MAIEILETMEESVVAAKAAKLIQNALLRARLRTYEPENTDNTDRSIEAGNIMPFEGSWSPFIMANDDPNFGLPLQFGEFGPESVFEDITGTLSF